MASGTCKNTQNNLIQEIDYNEIEQIQVIGYGSFGVVYKSIWNGKIVAVKNVVHETDLESFLVELRQLSRVNHKNIIQLYGASIIGSNICLVMEYAEGGSLHTLLHITRKVHYYLANAILWCLQAAQGVAYLHGMKPKPLIHRDLKPANLLLTKGGKRIKICDFGTVADKTTSMTNTKGSPTYMAPEVFSSSNYTEKCDVFSWSITLWEVLSRQTPYSNLKESAIILLFKVHNDLRPPLLSNCPPPLEKLMTVCWDKNPSKRPSMDEICEKMVNILQILTDVNQLLVWESDDECNNNVIASQSQDLKSAFNDSHQSSNSAKVHKTSAREENLQQPIVSKLDHMSNCSQKKEEEKVQYSSVPNKKNSSVLNEQNSSNSNFVDICLMSTSQQQETSSSSEHSSLLLSEEHEKLGLEYFKVQSELEIVSKTLSTLQEKDCEEEEHSQAIEELKDEKEMLLLVKESLENDLDNDGWMLL